MYRKYILHGVSNVLFWNSTHNISYTLRDDIYFIDKWKCQSSYIYELVCLTLNHKHLINPNEGLWDSSMMQTYIFFRDVS